MQLPVTPALLGSTVLYQDKVRYAPWDTTVPLEQDWIGSPVPGEHTVMYEGYMRRVSVNHVQLENTVTGNISQLTQVRFCDGEYFKHFTQVNIRW